MSTARIILINKPYDWTSFDVVKYIKKALGGVKIGHAGTLDPLATGLLVLCTGSLTKSITEIQDAEKEYSGTLVLGATTASYDLETETTERMDVTHLSLEKIRDAAQHFVGEILQTPPSHSAVKIGGRRAYAMARNEESFQIQPKKVVISVFEITRFDLPEISFRVVCGKGTYIRSLAHDFGKALGCGAHLTSLCRTRIGKYSLEDALEPAQFSRKEAEKESLS